MTTVSEQWKVENAGIDWITCSASEIRPAQRLWWLAEEISEQEQGEGRKRGVWGMKGLRGWSCGSVAWGARGDLVVVRAGGARAQLWWRHLVEAAAKVSRLDLQVTAVSQTPALNLASEAFESCRNWLGRGGKPLKSALITSSDGGATVYVGSRVSERMGRLYDKGVESETHSPGIRWRWELELKNESAKQIGQRLLRVENVASQTVSYVAGWFRERSVFCPAVGDINSINLDRPERPDDWKKLDYLDKSIRPMVQKLIASGRLEEVLSALGLQHCRDPRLRVPAQADTGGV